MHTLDQENKPVKQTRSVNSTNHQRNFSALSYTAGSMPYLQRIAGNQAIQRLLQSNNAGSDATTKRSTYLARGHGFNQIPMHQEVCTNFDSKLKFNTPEDKNKEKRDRVTDQVIRVPDMPELTMQLHKQGFTAIDSTFLVPRPVVFIDQHALIEPGMYRDISQAEKAKRSVDIVTAHELIHGLGYTEEWIHPFLKIFGLLP